MPLIALLMLVLVPGPAAAQVQPLESLRQAARAFAVEQLAPAGGGVEVEVGRLDPRLRLAACDKPLSAWLPDGSRTLGNTTVGVRCEGAKPWSLFVPVSIKVIRDVVVLARPTSRGTVLSREDVRLEPMDITALNSGYYSDPEQVVDRVLVHSLAVGRPLDDRSLRAKTVVRRGQQVTLLAQAGSIEVRMAGTALADGAQGERIRVRNSRSNQIVEGIVQGAGTVGVGL